MDRAQRASATILARKLQAYPCWRNANARHLDVLAAQRRERSASAANDNDTGANTRVAWPLHRQRS